MELFVQEERGQCRRDHGAQRRKDGAVEEKFAILPLSILVACYYAIPCL
jgi:hypothetical protein